jgi:hypothetical protein
VTHRAALLLLLAACDPPAIDSCRDSLAGVWTTDDGAALHVLDRGRAVEAYWIAGDPAFAGVPVAPALLDLTRRGDQLVGTELRRHHRGGDTCALRGPARLHGCRGDRAVLEVTPAGAPTDWTLCTPSSSGPRTTTLTRR